MNKEHFVDLRGKTFVLYSGLLAMAHEIGIESIQEAILQVPTPDNDNLAIVQAKVVDKEGRHWSGLGDASPQNVGRNIAPHVLRMASTRAKARALRDMCNIGVTALEELGDDDSAPAPVTPLREAQQHAKPQYQPRGEEPKPASRKQLNYLQSLVEDAVDGGLAAFEEKVGKPLSELTSKEATKLIERFKGKTG